MPAGIHTYKGLEVMKIYLDLPESVIKLFICLPEAEWTETCWNIVASLGAEVGGGGHFTDFLLY